MSCRCELIETELSEFYSSGMCTQDCTRLLRVSKRRKAQIQGPEWKKYYHMPPAGVPGFGFHCTVKARGFPV